MSNETKKRMSDAKKGKKPKNFELFIEKKKLFKPTKEQNEKRSIDYKNKGIKPPSRKGMEAWNKGKKGIHSEETIKSISKKVKEYLKNNPMIVTDEIRKKIGDAHRGEKCTFWKGGVSKVNCTERDLLSATLEYKTWRRGILERDNFTCQLSDCNKIGGKLRVHHIKRFIDYNDLRMDLRNGITICEKCDNSKIIHREKNWEMYFFSNLKNRGFINDEDIDFLNNYKKIN